MALYWVRERGAIVVVLEGGWGLVRLCRPGFAGIRWYRAGGGDAMEGCRGQCMV